jgi:hypothetical protein
MKGNCNQHGGFEHTLKLFKRKTFEIPKVLIKWEVLMKERGEKLI